MRHELRAHERLAITAAVLGFATLVVYLSIIVTQGDIEWVLVAIVASAIAVGSASAARGASVESGRSARWLLRLSAVLLGVLGVLAILTIGILLLAASAAAIIASVRTPNTESH